MKPQFEEGRPGRPGFSLGTSSRWTRIAFPARLVRTAREAIRALTRLGVSPNRCAISAVVIQSPIMAGIVPTGEEFAIHVAPMTE
jgi:hypothetical protein